MTPDLVVVFGPHSLLALECHPFGRIEGKPGGFERSLKFALPEAMSALSLLRLILSREAEESPPIESLRWAAIT